MSAVVFFVLLISTMSCRAAPANLETEIGEQCGPPPTVQSGDTVQIRKHNYKSGESVEFRCPEYYILKGNRIVRCLNGAWDEAPVCLEPCTVKEKNMEENNIQLRWKADRKLYSKHGDRIDFTCKYGFEAPPDTQMIFYCEQGKLQYPKCFKREIGEQCGPPPTVQSGDTVQIRKHNYKSGESVEFRCSEYYILKGNRIVKCLNGAWDEAPLCLEPCTAKEKTMEENNIQLRWKADRKFYTKHGDRIDFTCKYGFEAPPDTQMIFYCEQGKLQYPKCFKRGFCALQQLTMITNNIFYNISTVVDHGQTIVFQCNEGMIPENKLEVKCVQGNLNYPKCTASRSCKSPQILNGLIKTEQQASYNSSSYVEFGCNEEYVIYGPIIVKCENGQWTDLPVCHKIGEQCGPPPTVQSGDTVQIRKHNYKSGDSVEFICPEYYILKGNRIVRCLNGVWDEAPVCLEPCTAKEKNMEENNIQLRWKADRKLYAKHGDRIDFTCKYGFEAPPDTQMRFYCEQGKLQYPKCFKRGFCALQQLTMITNNIFYNISTVVDDGQTIFFQCNEGMIPENKLEAKCLQGNINYPKCTASRSCGAPQILNGLIKDEQQASYDSGSYVEFECNEDYVINGPIIVKCENSQWTDLPVCQSPCKISSEDLAKGNIELQSSDNPKNILDKNYKHETELSVTCKTGFRRPNQAPLVIECYDGTFRYPRCFSGKTCRINQDYVDENNLELDEVHNNEVYYEEGENITFKCKDGYRRRDKPMGKCFEGRIAYPKCTV
ncbi:complement factor H-related protein 4-like isoform X2 [Rhinoderma darwinii]|uniref:complement factor H-related protein 4-like isoform X2 n=1 Tax=Rhinoderma darwinii TaxID=43563 RepID=UPI003F669BF2